MRTPCTLPPHFAGLRRAPARPRAGAAPAALAFWVFALLLFVAPFLRKQAGVTWIGQDSSRAEDDIPFAEDVQDVASELKLDVDLQATLDAAAETWFGLESPHFLSRHLIEPQRIEPGEAVYSRYCAGCHGTAGDGDGPSARFLKPRPRNYTKGIFKFTSTASGQRPLRTDLFRTITRGLAGSSMPTFRLLPEESRWDVIEYVRYLAMRGEFERLFLDETYDNEELPDAQELAEIVYDRWDPDLLRAVYPDTVEPPFDEASIQRGDKLFHDPGVTNCTSCHGDKGHGDGYNADKYKDDWGYPIRPRDLTSGVFRAGEKPEDLWRSIATGIGGTPMGAFRNNLSGEDIWDLVHYIQSLAGRKP